MAYRSLNDYIQRLVREDEIRLIDHFVNPELEITEITDRVSKSPGGGKALLFTNNGTPFPLLINMFGSLRRMCLALGVESLEDTGFQIKSFMDSLSTPRPGILGKLSMLPRLKEAASYLPKTVSGRSHCQEVVYREPDLSIFPVLKCWPYDGGRFITLPMVHTIDPLTGTRNVGMYRMQVLSKNETAMHWHRHKTGARHFEEYRRLGKRMPVAVSLGGDPVLAYAATAPLPDQMDEYIFAGFLRKKRVELVKCISQDLEVPSMADIVIEGYIDPGEAFVLEGPFGDHTGFYSLADYYPRFHVTCITHRKDAVYPATVVGIPPQEDAWIARATEKIFRVPIRLAVVPELVDLHMPNAGVAHNLALVKIRKTYPGQAVKVMNALWGAGQMMFNKVMIVTDSDIPLDNYEKLLSEIALHTRLPDDFHRVTGPLDVLDHSSHTMGLGSKLGIDATRKLPEELAGMNQSIAGENEKKTDNDLMLKGLYVAEQHLLRLPPGQLLILLSVNDTTPKPATLAGELFRQLRGEKACMVILTDINVDVNDPEMVAWYCLNNLDPGRDIHFAEESDGSSTFVLVDGRRKRKGKESFERDWPNVIISDETTISAVNKVWDKLKIGNFIDSPSLRYKKLVGNEGAVAR